MLITQKPHIYKTLKNVIFCFLMLKMCVIFGQELPDKAILVIDSDHGDVDSCAMGENRILEKDAALTIVKEILRWIYTFLDGNYNIYLTRYIHTLISLDDRSRLAKALRADVFVSLHCNHAENSETKGMEVFVHGPQHNHSKGSLALGRSILNEVAWNLGIKQRGIESAHFQVLREVTTCASVLAEIAFLSHQDEAGYLSKGRNIRAIALAILLGIDNFKNLEL